MKKHILIAFFSLLTLNQILAQESAILIPYLKGKHFGYVNDKDKKIAIEPKFTRAFPFGYSIKNSFFPDYALVEIDNNSYVVDKKGKLFKQEDFDKNQNSEFYPPQIEQVITFKYIVFEKNKKKGLKDENENIVLEPVYDNLDLIYSYYNPSYYNKKTKKYYRPTYVNAKNAEQSSIIRVDKFKIYPNISFLRVSENSPHMIVSVQKNNEKINDAILTNKKLIKLNPKYLHINKYYEEQGLIYVEKKIDNDIINFYIDLKGNEYYEK